MERIAPLPRFHTHQHVISWLNEVMIDVKTMIAAGHIPLVRPYILLQWQELRKTLDCHDWHRPASRSGELYGLHDSAVRDLDAFVAALTAIWERRQPLRPVTAEWIEAIDRLYGNIEQCREDPIKY